MTVIICIFAVFIIPLNVVEILALVIKNKCPTYEEVGAIDVDLEKYGGTWHDYIHPEYEYSCALDVHSGFQNSTSYYFKVDYILRTLNGTLIEAHDVADPSCKIAKGYSGYDLGYRYMNAFLEIVYDQYSIEFACEETSAGPLLFLYGITRRMDIDECVLQKLEEFNKKLGLCLKFKNYRDQCKGLKL